jgi:hypothetical protein
MHYSWMGKKYVCVCLDAGWCLVSTLNYQKSCRPLYEPKNWINKMLHARPFVRPSVCPSVGSHFRNIHLSFYWKKWFYIWYMTLAWWLVPCLPFPGLPHIYFLFTVRLTNIKYKIISSSRSWDVCYESVNGQTDKRTDGQTDGRTDKVIAI